MTEHRGDYLHRMDDINHTDRLLALIAEYRRDLDAAQATIRQQQETIRLQAGMMDRLFGQLKLLRSGVQRGQRV